MGKRGRDGTPAIIRDFEEGQENQGLWEFERGFLYQIYTNF